MVLQCPADGADEQTRSKNSSWLISPAASLRRESQMTEPDPASRPCHQPSSIGPPDDTIAGRSAVAAAITGGQHNAVERVAVQHLDQRHVGQVAVERGRRTAAGLLNRVAWELERQPARVPDAVAQTRREVYVHPVARRQVGAGLRDADDGSARLQLLAREAEVEVPGGRGSTAGGLRGGVTGASPPGRSFAPLQIQRRHARVVGVVEPLLAPQRARRVGRSTGLCFPAHAGAASQQQPCRCRAADHPVHTVCCRFARFHSNRGSQKRFTPGQCRERGKGNRVKAGGSEGSG
eukprot:scaffold7685_cov103-Isochrysis_galbana.AAC.2